MVMLIDTPTLARMLQRVGVETFLKQLAERIEQDFARWASFEKSARLAVHSPQGVLELMPTADNEWFSFKMVNGHPANPLQGLLTVSAIGVLADMQTGYPRMISEMTLLTALRTAATSAMAAQHLANPLPNTMALIGTGAQGEFQALAFKACLGIKCIRYFDSDELAMQKFKKNLQHSGLELVACADVDSAVQGAQIITTATAAKKHQVVLTDRMVGSGVHINGIGGDCPGKTELDPALLMRSRVVVEYLPQSRIEGEIQALANDSAVTELWKIISGVEVGRANPTQVTLFDSVGFAIEDFSTLRYVYDKACELGFGRISPLVPAPADPKDLFGYMTKLAS